MKGRTIKGHDGYLYGPIQGLEGPIQFGSGRVLYWDWSEGRYYDRRTDLYLGIEEKP